MTKKMENVFERSIIVMFLVTIFCSPTEWLARRFPSLEAPIFELLLMGVVFLALGILLFWLVLCLIYVFKEEVVSKRTLKLLWLFAVAYWVLAGVLVPVSNSELKVVGTFYVFVLASAPYCMQDVISNRDDDLIA